MECVLLRSWMHPELYALRHSLSPGETPRVPSSSFPEESTVLPASPVP